MTSGTVWRDSRTSVSVQLRDCYNEPFTVNGLVGQFVYKDWSGSNSPKQVATDRTPTVYGYPIYSKKGEVTGYRKKTLWTPQGKMAPNKHSAPHNYSMVLENRSDGFGYYMYWCEIEPGRGTWKSAPISTHGRPNYAYSRLSQLWKPEDDYAMYGKLGAQIGSGFNLATFLGEGRESLRTITESATRIYKSFKALKKGKFLKSWNYLRGTNGGKMPPVKGANRKNLANNWLQFQYGWKPLLQDIYNACKHLAYSQNRDFTRTYRIRHSKTWAGKSNLSGTGVDPVQNFGGSAKVQKQWIAKVKSVNQGAILGLTDPRATAWELVPFSFVADWFIPIGDYLESINLRGALEGTYIMSTKQEAVTTSFISTPDGLDAKVFVYYNITNVTMDRSVGSSLAKPALPGLLPLEQSLTFKHALNAVALVVSRMRF